MIYNNPKRPVDVQKKKRLRKKKEKDQEIPQNSGVSPQKS